VRECGGDAERWSNEILPRDTQPHLERKRRQVVVAGCHAPQTELRRCVRAFARRESAATPVESDFRAAAYVCAEADGGMCQSASQRVDAHARATMAEPFPSSLSGEKRPSARGHTPRERLRERLPWFRGSLLSPSRATRRFFSRALLTRSHSTDYAIALIL
jgi:hypothetical protein